MNTLLRPEIIHPLIVHFPIACLSLGVFTRFLHFIFKGKGLFSHFLFTSRLLILAGVMGAWGAVLSGDLAAEIVEKTLCNAAKVEEHEDLGIMTSVIFSAFLCLDFAIERKFQDLIPANIKNTLIFLVLFSGLATLIVTGHHGASLVYNQGAAVQIPSPNECDALKNLGQ